MERDLLQFPIRLYSNRNEVELRHYRCLGAFQKEQEICFSSRCQCRRQFFSKYVRYVRSKLSFRIYKYIYIYKYIPRDFVNSTCFIELLSIVKDRSPLKISNLCFELSLINSVLLRVILFADNRSVILV